jgi:hypothetical protein
MDEFLAGKRAILRLRAHRGAMTAGYRIFGHWSRRSHHERLVKRERMLRTATKAAILSSISWSLHEGHRWSGYRSSFRTQYKRSSNSVPRVNLRLKERGSSIVHRVKLR